MQEQDFRKDCRNFQYFLFSFPFSNQTNLFFTYYSTIQNLRRKAEERNPDEFYFAMEKARTKDGVHQVPTAEPNKYTQEQLRLMKTQDAGYLNFKAQTEKKKVERMQESLHMIGAPAGQRKHVIFVDEESEVKTFDPVKHFDTPAELLDRSYNRPTKAQLENAGAVSGGAAAASRVARAEKRKVATYKELLQRTARQEALGAASQQVEYEKNVMGKGRKRKLTPQEASGKKGVFRWKNERKR
jgi:U3 small nucleolar RNA-associated protein 11